MLIVPDTTVFLADPMCSGDAWEVLAHAAGVWNLKIMVPSAVFVEAVGGYQRQLVELAAAFDGFAEKKRFRGLGLIGGLKDVEMAIHEASETYAEKLTQILSDLDASILPLPDVPHSVLVERAVSRRKPCDDHGDGYRDTLNWLTILELLRNYPDDIVWVSNNTKDFGSGVETESGSRGLHHELLDELNDTGFAGRVRYAAELREIISELAAALAPELPRDMHNLKDQLRTQTLSRFVAQSVFPGIAPTLLDPRRCALPVETITAELLAVGELENFRMEIRGSAGKGEALVDFVVTGESGIVLTLPNVYASEPTATVLPDGSGVEIQISKPLRYHGYLTTNSVGNPLAGEITRIVSKGDDPGRGEWQERDARDQLLQRTSLLEGIDPKVFEGLRPKFDPKLFEALRPKFDPKLFEGLRPKFDPKVLEALRPKFEPGVLEALRPKIDPKLFEGLRPKFDPKLFEGLRPKIDPKLFEGLRPKIDPKLFEGLRPKIDPKLFEGLRPKIDPKLFEAPRPTTPAPHEPDETTGPGDRSDSSLPHEDADSSGLSAAAPQASADSEPADAAPKPGSDENSGDGRHEAPADGETRPDET